MTRTRPWNPAVYDELRRLADGLLRSERAGHTLGSTALAHEAWIRLRDSRNAADLEHGAFLGLAGQAMRRILVDHARRRQAARRGGDAQRTTLDGKLVTSEPSTLTLDLEAALAELATVDPDLEELVELRFFAGGSTAEVAAVTGLSERTVKRRWRFARAWLSTKLEDSDA